MKIYVASSWRNQFQPCVIDVLRAAGHAVYDFRHPSAGDNGFHWSAIDPEWSSWTPEKFRAVLTHPLADEGFGKDLRAMRWADSFVLVCPAGRSAHLELGWAVGAGKRTAILLSDGEPELMYKLIDKVCISQAELVAWCEAR